MAAEAGVLGVASAARLLGGEAQKVMCERSTYKSGDGGLPLAEPLSVRLPSDPRPPGMTRERHE